MITKPALSVPIVNANMQTETMIQSPHCNKMAAVMSMDSHNHNESDNCCDEMGQCHTLTGLQAHYHYLPILPVVSTSFIRHQQNHPSLSLDNHLRPPIA